MFLSTLRTVDVLHCDYMRYAYGMLGLAFVIVFGGAYLLVERAEAPTQSHGEAVSSPSYESNDSRMLTLTSPAFSDGTSIPSRFTCEGENVNPELHISNVPEGTVSLALTMTDPDIPESVKQNMGITVFDHWVVFNIPADTRIIEEAATPPGIQGMNSAGQGYTGPCPPDGEHRYIFTLYALDSVLALNSAASRAHVVAAIGGHVLEKTTLTGVYEKRNQ